MNVTYYTMNNQLENYIKQDLYDSSFDQPFINVRESNI
jgi:hypothetical protein